MSEHPHPSAPESSGDTTAEAQREGTSKPLPQTALSKELFEFRDRLNGKDCTLGDLVQIIGERGFPLLLLLLSLPAALPVPATGYGTPFGLLMAFLGIQMVYGRKNPWIPGLFRNRKLPYSLVDFSIRNSRLPLRAVEILIRPRLSGLARNRWFLAGVGVTITLLSLCMSMPIPLTNTAPSFVIFVLAAGILEEDGLVLLGGMLLAPVAVGIAALAIYFAFTYGLEDDKAGIKEKISELFS